MSCIQKRGSRGQFTTEYLIVVSIALTLIAFFLVYVFVYYAGYTNTSLSSKVSNVASTITNEADYVTGEGLGSKISFSLDIPKLTLSGSFFCGNYIKVSSGSYSSIQDSKMNLEGILPTTAGSYIMYAVYNNSNTVQIGFISNISYVNYSYSMNGNYLEYDLQFFGKDRLHTGSTAYNISVFTQGGEYINSTLGSSTDGTAVSSIYLSQVPSTLLIYVFPLSTNVVAPSCFQT